MKKNILIVFGTRPEAIKMAPVVKAFQLDSENFNTRICVTGQHREMLDQVLQLFDITPDYDLDIMQAGQDLYDITARVVQGMKDVLTESEPNLVFVHGDTTTSSMTALAAFYQQILVAHVEAGLRTHNIYSPWPEEINRQITGRIASYHFAPTEQSRLNLLNEGIKEQGITVTGNTVIDALHLALNKIEEDSGLKKKVVSDLMETLKINKVEDLNRIILVTGHRRENFGEGFLNICSALAEIAKKFPSVNIVYPVHLNPNVREPVFDILSGIDNIRLINPLEYLPFVYLMNKSYLVLTDSGGIQEEAPGLGKPVIVMRDTTERPEAVEAGTVELVGTKRELIVQKVSDLLTDTDYYTRMSTAHNPYGDGKASERILKAVRS